MLYSVNMMNAVHNLTAERSCSTRLSSAPVCLQKLWPFLPVSIFMDHSARSFDLIYVCVCSFNHVGVVLCLSVTESGLLCLRRLTVSEDSHQVWSPFAFEELP